MKNLKNLTLVSALIAAAGLGAQENVGTVVGTVRDTSGAPVANATVRISGHNLLQPRDTTTDASGRYMFRLIMPGEARVQVSKQGLVGGFHTVMVTAGSTRTVDLTMRALNVATEEVEITGAGDPIVDKTESKVTSTYTIRDLFNLPMGGSGMYGALFLAPGVSGNVDYARIRGGTTGQVTYSVNGIQMRDAEVGQGRQNEYLIDDMIQDVQVVQNPINAKYGFTSTGSVNVTTKTGTNRFEGTFRVRLSNSAWNAINGTPVINRFSEQQYDSAIAGNWSTLPTNPAREQLGKSYFVTLSGPIWKDHITFSYGGRFEPQSYRTITYRNVLDLNPSNWRTYLPGFTRTTPKYMGPNQLDPSQPDSERWAGYFWGRNPAAPTDPIRDSGTLTNAFNQYKLFFQITQNHQVDALYSKNFRNSFGANYPTDGVIDTNLKYWQSETSMLKGFNYRGIFGSNAVLTAQWGNGYSDIKFPKGPDDPLYVNTWQQSAESLIHYGSATTQMMTGGASFYDAIRESKNWGIDLNYIWESHNIDVGVQQLNEMSTITVNGGGINGQDFYVPGRRYDGTYLVFNPFHSDSPVNPANVTGTGEINPTTGSPLSTGTMAGYTTVAAWQNAIRNGTRVPLYRKWSGTGGFQPYDAQTRSVYINDNWTYNDHFAVSAGLRGDQTIATDQRGEIVNSMAINPRFRAQYDLFGDNRHVFSLSVTQQVGNLQRSAIGAFGANSTGTVNRRYTWTKDNPDGSEKPFFVSQDELKDYNNYKYYYSYSNTLDYYKIDKDLGPEQTTNTEFMYKRVFDQGGWFRVSLVYGLLTRALFAENRDEVVVMTDPTGQVPQNPAANQFVRYLYNRSDRGRHYAGAELEWKMFPMVSPTWRLEWGGSWTIAKTTGNYVFGGAANDTTNTDGSSIQSYDQLIKIGMPKELVDPWGESTSTPRHAMRTYATLSHGDRGGILNELTLFANWDSGTFTNSTWSYNLPNDTWKNSNLEGGTVSSFPTTASLYAYGFGHRMSNGNTYFVDFSWNVTIPVKKTLSMFVNFMIGNIFNSIVDGQGTTGWSSAYNNGDAITWVRGQKAGENDPMYGKYVASRTSGQTWGVYGSAGGARQFNSKLEFGFRF